MVLGRSSPPNRAHDGIAQAPIRHLARANRPGPTRTHQSTQWSTGRVEDSRHFILRQRRLRIDSAIVAPALETHLVLVVGSKVFGPQPGVLRDARQHARADVDAVVEGPHVVGPAFAREHPVGASLSFDLPADAHERCQDTASFGGAPRRHEARDYAANASLKTAGISSPWSSRSATTRRARAMAPRRACSASSP